VVKGTFPVIWKSNSRAWVTALLSEDRFTIHFVSEVQKYCAENDLPFKVLLILQCAQVHPQILEHENPNINIVLLPPNSREFGRKCTLNLFEILRDIQTQQ
jgi:hypothetical protein